MERAFLQSVFRRRLSFTKIVCLLFLMVLISACGGSSPSVTATPTPSLPHLPNSQYTVLNLGIPQKALDAPIIGTLPGTQILHIGVTFKVNQSAVDQWNKSRANHAKKGGVSASTIANQLGITDAEYQEIKAFFGIEDATLALNKLHTYLAVDARVSTLNFLLHTSIVMHQLNGRKFYTPDPAMPPEVPTFIAAHIVSITGLENYSMINPSVSFVPQQRQAQANSTHQHLPADCNPNSQTLNTNQIAAAYGYNQFWQHGYHGEGLTVNLVENDTFFPDDLAAYFQCVGYNSNNFNVVNIDGQPTQVAGESMLDIELIAGLAPGSTIMDYQAGDRSFQSMLDALQQIINDNANKVNNASVVSISLGAPENGLSGNVFSAIDSSLQQLVQVEHMTVFIASGDCAAFIDEKYGDLSVSFPASDPLGVAVGGTELSVDSNGNRSGEIAWSNGSNTAKCKNQWGTGGGLSTVFSRASWQQANGVNNKYSNGKRQLPDVSAIANNIAFYIQGRWVYNGGTSAAAPIWAAGMLLVNQALLTNLNQFFYGPDTFYQVANSAGSYNPYYDVTQGNNLYYPATVGWDYPTGIGTPNLVDFYNVLYTIVRSGG